MPPARVSAITLDVGGLDRSVLTVLTDPDGNEFCVSRRPSPATAQSDGGQSAGAKWAGAPE